MFEKKLECCPACRHRGSSGLIPSSHFYVYTCSQCGHTYCYQCPGSNNGERCPSCSHTGKDTKGIVYIK